MSQRRNPAPIRSHPVPLPAPIGGWNARDSIDAMPPTDAILMDNWFPDVGYVAIRKGFLTFATGVSSGQVETLAQYWAGATRKLLAAGGTAIYNVTSGTASSLKSGLTNARWQTINFNASMLWVNGADTPQVFDGSSFADTNITGPTVTNLIGCNVFKSRVYVWEANSQSFWYGATNAIGGAFTEFPLKYLSTLGGNLMFMATWSRETSNGFHDFAVFVMSSGDVVIYDGNDPGTAANWLLVGIYKIGAPMGRRSYAKIAGDLVLITTDGYVSLSEMMASNGAIDQARTISSKIRGAAQLATQQFYGAFGWEAIQFPLGNWILFNVPSGATFEQHVMNAITKAWCRFEGMNGATWCLYNDLLYFGGPGGKVFQANVGTYDDTGAGVAWERITDGWETLSSVWEAGAANITADCRQAFSYLTPPGQPVLRKRNAVAQPILQGGGRLGLTIGLDYDFTERTQQYGIYTLAPNIMAWEQMAQVWEDWSDNWDAGDAPVQPRVLCGGVGYAASLRVKAQTQDTLKWLSSRLYFETGGGKL